MSIKFKKLTNSIIKCGKCPRLIKFSKKISTVKRKEFINETYWGKPLAGFGDIKAKLLIVGLAPAAHGGNRTGRAFTGDKSGKFLFNCLYKAKISSLPLSLDRKDGLKLNDGANYLNKEINNLKNLKVIIALGKVAFDNCIKFYKKKFLLHKLYIFKHGKKYMLPDGKFIIACYHPSPRNVNTKLINLKIMKKLFIKAKNLI